MPTPEADRPHYYDGTPIPTHIDATTQLWSRGLDHRGGVKHAEPAEPAPTITSLTPNSGPAAGGTAVTIAGDNLGGSTGVTVGGAAATLTVNSETEATFTAPAGTVGAQDVVVANPAGNATLTGGFTYA